MNNVEKIVLNLVSFSVLGLFSACRSDEGASSLTAATVYSSYVCQTRAPNTAGLPYEIRISKPDPRIRAVKYGPNDYNVQIRDRRQGYYVEVVQGKPSATAGGMQVQFTGPLQFKLQINAPTLGSALLNGTVTVFNAEALTLKNEPVVCQGI